MFFDSDEYFYTYPHRLSAFQKETLDRNKINRQKKDQPADERSFGFGKQPRTRPNGFISFNEKEKIIFG
jgi:hypothetical protein